MYIKKDPKIVYTKVSPNVNIVDLSSLYPNNCSEQSFEVVNDEVLQALIDSNRYIAKIERKIRDNEAALPYDDTFCSRTMIESLSQIEQFSFEVEEIENAQIQHQMDLRRLFNTLTDKQRMRIYLHIKYNMTYQAIATLEGISSQAVQYSCNCALKKLKENSLILLNRISESWIELLKPPNWKNYLKKYFHKP